MIDWDMVMAWVVRRAREVAREAVLAYPQLAPCPGQIRPGRPTSKPDPWSGTK